MRKKRIVLGITKEKELILGNYEVRTWNGYKEFSATFDTVRPFQYDEEEAIERMESCIACYDKETVFNWLEAYDCRPSQLAEYLVDDSDVSEIWDCSIFPDCIYSHQGNAYYFESISGGQHDTREEAETIFDDELYELIHYFWDNYHLRSIENLNEKEAASMEKLETLAEKYRDYTIYEPIIADSLLTEIEGA